jgi:hypothetical protein
MHDHPNDHQSVGPAGAPGVPDDGETMTSILDSLAAEGHEDEVILNVGTGDGPTGTWSGCGHSALLRDAKVLTTRRLEGASDPADMSTIEVLGCPTCGATATVVLRYGPEAEPLHIAALAALDDEATGPA